MTGQKPAACCQTWSPCVHGDVYQLRAPRDTRGHEQRGNRYAVVVQSDILPLSTWLISPTSTSAREASIRPEVEIDGKTTRVLVEQTAAVDPERLGAFVCHLTTAEMAQINAALTVVLGLDPRWG
jgi:mRNA interferase MazF